MSKSSRLIFLFLLIVLLTVLGCENIGSSQNSVVGLYVDPENQIMFLRINGDGTFDSFLLRGDWERHGSELTLISPLGLQTFKIDGDKLVSPNQVFIKKK